MLMALRVILAMTVSTAIATANVMDPNSWTEEIHWKGVGSCTKIQVAKNGEVFCALKNGILRRYPSVNAKEDEYIDIWSLPAGMTTTFGDRGMLGMAVHLDFPTNPYIWVLSAVNRAEDLQDSTVLPNTCDAGDGGSIKPGADCDTAGRLYRVRVNADIGSTEQILMSGWCSNGMSHNVGSLVWANDGGLYISSGDGASYTVDDRGTPGNVCYRPGDARMQGAWRSQWDDYTQGKILYISKGDLMSNTPLEIGKGAKIVAKGLRNPFRFAVHPVTQDLYIGDVGSDFYEEINVVPDPLTTATIPNFGWPCFEGLAFQPRYGADDGCADIMKTAVKPFISYSRGRGFPIPGAQEHCMRGSVSPSAFTFMASDRWGPTWTNRMIWADSSMQCIFALANDDKGMPDPDTSKMELLAYNDPTGVNGKFVDFAITEEDDPALYAVEYDQSQVFKFNFKGDRTGNKTVQPAPTRTSTSTMPSTTNPPESSALIATISSITSAVLVAIMITYII